jgi:sigma-B regulation protein RsbU (phosphoserine phosphatase)
MIRKTIVIIAVAFFACINAMLVIRAVNFSHSYPFDRFVVEGRLHFPAVMKPNMKEFGAEIISINGVPVHDTIKLIDMICNTNIYEIVYSVNGEKTGVFPKKGINSEIFVFVLFIILCANIHLIWAVVIRYQFSNQISGRLFSYYSFGVACMLFSFVHYLLFQWTALCIAASSLFMSYIIVRTGLYLLEKKQNKLISVLTIIIMGGAIGAISLLCDNRISILISFQCISASGIFTIVAACIRLSRNIRISRKIGVIMIIIAILSMIFPINALSVSLFRDVFVPVGFYIAFSIILPLILANNFATENIRETFSIKKRYIFRVFMDGIVSVCLVAAIHAIITRTSGGYIGFIIPFILVYGILLVLWLRKRVYDIVKTENPVYRDIFSDAVRRVSEISASPLEFSEKIGNMNNIIKETTGVRYIHIELFEMSIINKIEGLDDVISYSRGGAIEQYIVANPHLMNRDAFFSGTVFGILGIENKMIELIVPIRSKGYTIGILQVGAKESDHSFADDEINFFHSLSIVLYQLIENEILFREYVMKREYEHEIDIASYIQMRLFPKRLPIGKGIQIAYFSRPYLKVTGDYYDFIDINEMRTLIAIGDVAGHGLSAATILAVVGNILHAMIREGKGMGEIMNELNHFFSIRYRGSELMTLFLIEFNVADRSIAYINAGHCAPILFRDNSLDRDFFSVKSPILGADIVRKYETTHKKVVKDDEIILYTDGIIEIQGDRFGNNVGDRILLDALEEGGNHDIDRKIGAFSDQIEKFPHHAIHDDITVIGVKVN